MFKSKISLLCLPSVKNIKQVLANFSFPISLTKGCFENLEFIFYENTVEVLHRGIDLKNFSFVWLSSLWDSRDLAYAIKLYLGKNDVFSTYVEKSTSKITDQMTFCLDHIKTPDSLFLGTQDIRKKLGQIKKVCGYPLIAKDIKGSRGLDSIYIANQEELFEKMAKFPKHRQYLFQKYIPNQYDWGILVVNGAVVSGEKSYPQKGEFRNNVCNGAREVFVDPAKIPLEIKKIAIRANNLLGLSWSRSDIIIDCNTKEPYLLEVNRLPGVSSKSKEVDGAYQFLSAQFDNSISKK